jgi:hypothetical protein
LARIGPGQLVEPLNGDPTVVIQLPFVNNVGSFETVLRDYVIGCQGLGKREFGKNEEFY